MFYECSFVFGASFFTLVMWINGARYFDRASTEAIFYHYVPSKREERNWKLSQKIYGKNLLIAGVLNLITEVVLIAIVNQLFDATEQSDSASYIMLFVIFLPSLIYMFGARLMMGLKLKRLEEIKEKSKQK